MNIFRINIELELDLGSRIEVVHHFLKQNDDIVLNEIEDGDINVIYYNKFKLYMCEEYVKLTVHTDVPFETALSIRSELIDFLGGLGALDEN